MVGWNTDRLLPQFIFSHRFIYAHPSRLQKISCSVLGQLRLTRINFDFHQIIVEQ